MLAGARSQATRLLRRWVSSRLDTPRAPAAALPNSAALTDSQARAARNKLHYLSAKAAFNRGDLDACMAFYAETHQLRSADVGPGREHIRAFLAATWAAWGDLQLVVEHAVAEDEWVMGRCRFTATHSQIVMDLPPTGRTVDTSFWDLHRFDAQGRICETWNVSDQAAVLRQLTACDG